MNVHFATSAQESFLKIDVIGFQEGLSVIQTQDVNASTTGPYGQHDAQEKHYPSDLTDEEWEYIAAPANRYGWKLATDFREIINALRYPVRSGDKLGNVAGPFWSVADRLLAIPQTNASFPVPDHP